MSDYVTPDLKHGAALRVSVRSASVLGDGTLAIVTGMGSVLTIDGDDAKKIAAAMKEQK